MSSDLPATPKIKHEDLSTDHESPIKQMSDEIRNENEQIIRNIKKESSPRLPNLADTPERTKLRNISETVPYVLRHERIIARQQKLEELEAQSAKELQKRIQELEKKAQDLKLRERLLKQQAQNGSASSLVSSSNPKTQLKKGDTYTDLNSIVSSRD